MKINGIVMTVVAINTGWSWLISTGIPAAIK